MVGWLVCGWVGGLTGGSVDKLVRCLVGWLVDSSFVWFAGSIVGQLVCLHGEDLRLDHVRFGYSS